MREQTDTMKMQQSSVLNDHAQPDAKRRGLRGALVLCCASLAVVAAFALPSGAWGNRVRIAEGQTEDASIAAVVSPSLSSTETITPAIYRAIQEADFPFTSVAGTWPASLTRDLGSRLEVRTRTHTTSAWSAWRAFEPLRDAPHAVSNETVSSELLFVPSADALQLRLVGPAEPTALAALQDVSLTYLGIRRTPLSLRARLRNLLSPARAEDAALPIVSRADWGADESYRLVEDGSERWVPSYAAPQKFIVHHTVTNDGATDAAAVVQQIYYYHANVVEGDGWGDIGYNYLIDANGVIYEGRSGDDGVVGGHTYDSATKTNYNVGSVGVALLGNYETNVPTPAALASLASLVARKAQRFGITPSGTGYFLTGVYPNLIGHNDVDATLCPGKNLKTQLDAVRATAQSILDALPPLPQQTFSAERVSPADASLTLPLGATTTFEAAYRNTGTAAWQSYLAPQRVALVPVDGTETAKIQSGWVSGQEVGGTAAANVEPGATATFRVTVTAPTDTLDAVQTFALRAPDGSEMPNTRFTLTVSATNIPYAAAILDAPPPTAFVKSVRRTALRVENRGANTWERGDVLLRVANDGGQGSAFKAASWKSATADVAMEEAAVAPGEIATFAVELRAPKTPGLYRHDVRVVRNDGTAIITDPLLSATRVDSHWQATLAERTIPAAVQRGWRTTVTLRFKNTGVAAWNRGLLLRVYDERGKASAFRNPVWRSRTGDATLAERSVPPGATGTFTLRLRAPSTRGLHRLQFRLELKNGKETVQHDRLVYPVRVD